MLKVDPARLQGSDWSHTNAVEEVVGRLLAKHLFVKDPIVTRTYGNVPEYDLMFDLGGADVLRAELKITRNAHLPVEFISNGKGTGISSTTADFWVFINTGITKFDGRGVDTGNGHRFEGKLNIIKPDTLLQFIVDNADDTSKVTHVNCNGVEVAYVNPYALEDKYWFGTCDIILRDEEMEYTTNPIKSFDLETFRVNPNFKLKRILRNVDKLETEELSRIARDRSDRLVDIVMRDAE